jgi:hypothetical protein
LAMSSNCVSMASVPSGSTFTGLISAKTYYVAITALPPVVPAGGYLSVITPPASQVVK